MCAADATGHLLLGQFPEPPCWDGKKRTWSSVATASESPPQHSVLCWQLGHTDHGNTRAGRRHSTPANKHRAKRGKQEHRAELTWFEAKLGVGGESTAKPHSRNLSRVRQLIQHGCEGQHKHPALESRTGSGSCGRRKEGKFPVTGTGQGRLSAVRAGEGLTGCHGRGYKQNNHLPKRSESMRM